MQRLLEYTSNHPLLAIGTAVMILAAVAFEFLRARASGTAVSPADAVRLLNQGALMIDVRPKEQFDAGHIIDARNLPSGEVASGAETLKKYKDKVVVACCETGNTGAAAARTLRAQGFTKVVNLRGGLTAWRGEKLPLVRTDAKGR